MVENGTFRTGYVSYMHFFRFENNTQTIYNLYDAGNFMWGNWMNANKYNYFIAKTMSQTNELGQDPETDQRAIKNGFHFWNFKTFKR